LEVEAIAVLEVERTVDEGLELEGLVEGLVEEEP